MHPSRHNPFRTVDWRARRCEHLLACGERPSHLVDDWPTGRAWRFHDALRRAGDDAARECVRARFPDLVAALAIREWDGLARAHLILRARAVEVEMVIPVDDPSEPCYESETVQFLREVKQRTERGDLAWLKQHGKVYAAVGAA